MRRVELRWVLLAMAVLMALVAALSMDRDTSAELRLEDGTHLKLVLMDASATRPLTMDPSRPLESLVCEYHLVLIKTSPSGQERWVPLERDNWGGIPGPLELKLQDNRVTIQGGYSGHGHIDLQTGLTTYDGKHCNEVFPERGSRSGTAPVPGALRQEEETMGSRP
jgi:hypothetical protein